MQLRRKPLMALVAALAVLVVIVFMILDRHTTRHHVNGAMQSNNQKFVPTRETSRVSSPLVKVSDTEGIDRSIYSDKIRAFQDEEVKRNKPLQMFARILDQYGQPVPGVALRIGWAYIPLITAPGVGWSSKSTTVQSDENGEFSVESQNGLFMDVESAEKSGFQFKDLSRFTVVGQPEKNASTPDNRLIIRAWKIEPPKTRVVEGVIRAPFPADGQFVSIALDQGMRGKELKAGPPNGDLYIAAKAGPRDGTGYFDWTVNIQAIDGGIQEIDQRDAFPYVAPESGYAPGWSESRERVRTASTNKSLFVKSRNGTRYSRIDIHITSPDTNEDGKAYVKILFTTNIDGARELPEQR